MVLKHGRYRVPLNGRGAVVAHEFHILQHDGMKASVFERADWLDSDWSLLLDFDPIDTVSKNEKKLEYGSQE